MPYPTSFGGKSVYPPSYDDDDDEEEDGEGFGGVGEEASGDDETGDDDDDDDDAGNEQPDLLAAIASGNEYDEDNTVDVDHEAEEYGEEEYEEEVVEEEEGETEEAEEVTEEQEEDIITDDNGVEAGPEDEEQQEQTITRPNKRLKSLAFAYLQGQATHSSSTLSPQAQTILQTLLQDQGFAHDKEVSEVDVAKALAIVAKLEDDEDEEERPLEDATGIDNDISIVMRTKQPQHRHGPKLSYLKTFLAVLERELQTEAYKDGVPARILIKHSCLAVRPEHLPAALDAEEYAMAALEFLASTTTIMTTTTSTTPPSNTFFSALPLIQAVKEENDIKRRVYVKAGEGWELDTLTGLAALERVWFADATSYRWLRRGAFCPRSDNQSVDELDPLLRKGRHKLVTGPPKKKPLTSAGAVPKRPIAGGGKGAPSPASAMLSAFAAADEDDEED